MAGAAKAAEVLSTRQLNRATLARQMLLAREETTPAKAIERLVGLQAQLARPPFVGLWSRVAGFQAEDLAKLAHARKVVRGTLMRGTLHLVTTKDYLALRPLLQPMLSAAMKGVLGERAVGLDVDRLVEAGRAALEERPRTFEELRAALKKKWPNADERAVGYVVRTHLPLVQVPDETRWGWPGAAAFAVAESWIRKPIPTEGDLGALVLRYLAGFGPAGVRDMEAWSGLRGLEEAFAAVRPKLVAFHDARGRELFDLPKAPRPPADTPAPVRFLPDYDNLLLGHADRTRIIGDEHRSKVSTANLRVLPTFLVDGFAAGTWRTERARSSAALVLDAFQPLTAKIRGELAAEGKALVQFLESDVKSIDVRLGA